MENVPMKRYTSMKVGGPARYLMYPADERDLTAMLVRMGAEGTPSRFLGNGTNIIVNDRGIDQALIRISRLKHRKYAKSGPDVRVEVSGGVSLTAFIRENARRGLSGLEKLFWIPGTVGGGIKMNAGSFGAAIADPLEEIRVVGVKGNTRTIMKKDDNFSYRHSPVENSDCVVNAVFRLKERDRNEIFADMEYVYRERKKRHPMEYPSSGSVFKSVSGEPAWKFIEKAGLKGIRVGDAAVSEKHANFIINLGSATAADIRALVERIKKEVYEKCGVTMEEEVEFWGYHGQG